MRSRTSKHVFDCARRFASSEVSKMTRKYPSKVRAFPFVVSKEEAIKTMAPTAAFFTYNSPFREIIGSLFSVNFKPIQPARIQPVYFPCWYIDAEIQADIWRPHQDSKDKRTVTMDLSGSYLPGFPFEPLSRLCFKASESPSLDPIVYPEDTSLKLPSGEDIITLPHTISPMAALNMARSLPPDDALIQDDFSFDPFSVKPNMLAAYPILFPVYIAQYDLHEPLASFYPGRKSHSVLEAHASDGRLAVFPVHHPRSPAVVAREEYFIFRDYADRHFAGSDDEMYYQLRGVVDQLDELASKAGAASTLAQVSASLESQAEPREDGIVQVPVDMDQPWVRPYSKEEVAANRGCMQRALVGRQNKPADKPDWWVEWAASQPWLQ